MNPPFVNEVIASAAKQSTPPRPAALDRFVPIASLGVLAMTAAPLIASFEAASRRLRTRSSVCGASRKPHPEERRRRVSKDEGFGSSNDL